MPDNAAMTDTAPISLTDSAANRIGQLIKMEDNDAMKFRVSVSGGGCNGFQTAFSLDDQAGDDDTVFEINGVAVIVDTMTAELVIGSELDYVDELIGSYFSLNNPNASSTCGCGSSFAL